MSKKVYIFGGVGVASSIAMAMIDARQRGASDLEFCGYINNRDGISELDGFPVVQSFDEIPRLIDEGCQFIYTFYKIDGQLARIGLFESLNIPDENLATFIHPDSFVAPNCTIGPGTVILPQSTISGNAELGRCVRINSQVAIGHDCVLGEHTFVGGGTAMASEAVTGKAAYIGLGARILGKARIAEYSVVGMGSVVTRNVAPYELVTGNPARFRRYVKDRPAD